MKKPSPTPNKVRSAKSKDALLESGGRRITMNLSAKATQALAEIKAHRNHKTDTAAVAETLIRRASKLKK